MTARAAPSPLLLAGRLIAVVRAASGDHVDAACDALVDEGVRCLEVTTNTDGAMRTVRRLVDTHGDAVAVGVGTVRTVEQVRESVAAGASYVLAPNTSEAVGRAAAEAGIGWYPGAFTPTEIERAWTLGATAVKVFPAGLAGGPQYLREVRGPLDDVLLLPTGGVAIEDIGDYLGAGAVAVGLGGPLLGDAARTGELDALRQRARTALTAASPAGPV